MLLEIAERKITRTLHIAGAARVSKDGSDALEGKEAEGLIARRDQGRQHTEREAPETPSSSGDDERGGQRAHTKGSNEPVRDIKHNVRDYRKCL